MRARSLTLAIAAIGLLPAIAAAQEEAQEFDAAQNFLVDDTWVLDDGVGVEDKPWNTYDPVASYLPRGQLHFGMQLRLGALPGGDSPAPDGPLADVSAFLDIRYSERGLLRLRLALAFSAQPYGESFRSAGVFLSTSPWALRLRAYPLSLDIATYLTFRVAGELGLQWTARPDQAGGAVGLFYAGSMELVGLLLDGQLEVGVFGGLQATGVGETSRTGYRQYQALDFVVGATVAYLL